METVQIAASLGRGKVAVVMEVGLPMKSFVNTYNFHRVACVVSHYLSYG